MVAALSVLVVANAWATAHAAAQAVHGTWAAEVKTTTAELKARIDPGGDPTTYRFEFITEAAYLANVSAARNAFSGAERIPSGAEASAGRGSGDVLVTRRPGDLVPETTYRYRVVATDIDGPVNGPERVLTTKGAGLPPGPLDARGWELVSPIDKNGGEIQGPEAVLGGGVFQAAGQGEAVTFSSTSSFATGGEGAPGASQYISRRGADGWVTENVTAPLSSGGYGEEPDGVPYRIFSDDLAGGLQLAPDGPPPAGSGAPAGYRNYYLRDFGGGFEALLTFADIAGLTVPPQRFELSFSGASPDLEHVVLSSCAALAEGALEVAGGEGGCDPADPNLYEWSRSGLRLVNTASADFAGGPPARLAAPSGAISSDGSRVYWTNGANLYLSEEGEPTAEVDKGAGGGGSFQTASASGSVAFFTKGGGLYRYDAPTHGTTELTPTKGVLGVLGASADGSSVYFLTTAGLFLNRGGTNFPVAASADPSNYPPSTGTARVSADGNRLAFVSSAQLTDYENTNPEDGEVFSEIYLYDAGGKVLRCVSCDRTGEIPSGSASLPGAIANGQGAGATAAYRPRVLVDDGNRLFFDSSDALATGDANNAQDVYEWEARGSGSCARPGGCVQLVSAGISGPSSFIDASASGGDVFFLTDNSLVRSDPGASDLYDAREGGGFAEAPTQVVCEEDSCQPLPSPPDDPLPGTLVPAPGNPPPHFSKARKAKPRHKKHHHSRRHQRRGAGR